MSDGRPTFPGPRGFAARLRRGLRMPSARRAVRRLGPGLTANQDALLEFDQVSSAEFAAITDGLGGLAARLSEVAVQAAQLDVVLRDADEDHARSSAFELYKKSVDLAHASIGISLSQEEEMQQLEGRLLENRTQFEQNSVMFRVLVLNVRAEAARIDPENQAVFASVAAEMDAMERQMHATVDTAFSELEAIIQEAAGGRQELQKLQTDLHHGAQRSIQVLRGELDDIKAKLAPCAVASQRITALLAQSRGQTGDLIVALQYQDIVRQQLDHVAQGFSDLAAHVAAAPGRSAPDLGYLHHAARVQHSHLATSRRAIEEAGRQIQAGSDELLATGTGLVESFAAMEQLAGEVFRASRLGDIFLHETDNLVKVAEQSEATNDRIGRLLDRIEKSVKFFSIEIRRHEFEVLLVALNAQVAAARVPAARALDKLAEETARLSIDTARLTEAMSAQLTDMLARLQAMRTEADSVRRTISREKADLARGAVEVKDKLNRLNERLRQSTGETPVNFLNAYGRVRDQLAALRFPALIATAFAPAENTCDALLAATAPFATADLSAEGTSRLADHQGRYTMEGERAAHAAAVGASAPGGAGGADAEIFFSAPATPSEPAEAIAPSPPAADAGVELF